MDTPTPYIPATALGGDLVRDWSGEGLAWIGDRWIPVPLFRGDLYQPKMTLDLRRPEVAHRIADVLRARGHEVGPLLPVALGGRVAGTIADRPCPCGGQGVEVGPGARGCVDCGLRGTVRTLVPAADVSALLFCASVAGVEAGVGAVRGTFLDWKDPEHATIKPSKWPSGDYASRYCLSSDLRAEVGSLIHGRHDYRPGWWIRENDLGRRGPVLASGPETSHEGRAAADAALLRLGFAYLDPSAPFGVRVPFLNRQQRGDPHSGDSMDTTDLDKIEARLNAATPGPWTWRLDRDKKAEARGWRVINSGRRPVVTEGWYEGTFAGEAFTACGVQIAEPDADLIAHAPEDLRALVAEVRRLTDASLSAIDAEIELNDNVPVIRALGRVRAQITSALRRDPVAPVE